MNTLSLCRRHRCWSLLLVLVSTLSILLPASRPAEQPSVVPDKNQILETSGQLPLSFEANQGQTDKQVKFLSRCYACSSPV